MTTADLLGKILQVVMGLAVFAAVVGLLIFFIDKAPKKGRDYWQLALFLLPAMLFVAIGLVYPAIRTSLLAFQNNAGEWTPRQLHLDVHPARRHPHAHQHDPLGGARTDHLDGDRPRVRRVHRQVAR